MKKTAKIYSLKKALLITALTSLLVPGLSIAAQIGPDLRVSIRITDVRNVSTGVYNYNVVTSIRNIGNKKYSSRAGQQNLSLYKNNTSLIKTWNFTNVNIGQTVRFTKSFRNASYGEFTPSYKAMINFDPDLYVDGYTSNDDTNKRNNSASISSTNVNTALNRSSRPMVNTKNIQLRPQDKAIQKQIQPQYKFK